MSSSHEGFTAVHAALKYVVSWRRPGAVESNSLDHEDGIDSFSWERTFMVRPRNQVLGGAPAMALAQVHKDKNTFKLQVPPLTQFHSFGRHSPISLPALMNNIYILPFLSGISSHL